MPSSKQWGEKEKSIINDATQVGKMEYNVWAVFVTHKKSIGQRGGQQDRELDR